MIAIGFIVAVLVTGLLWLVKVGGLLERLLIAFGLIILMLAGAFFVTTVLPALEQSGAIAVMFIGSIAWETWKILIGMILSGIFFVAFGYGIDRLMGGSNP